MAKTAAELVETCLQRAGIEGTPTRTELHALCAYLGVRVKRGRHTLRPLRIETTIILPAAWPVEQECEALAEELGHILAEAHFGPRSQPAGRAKRPGRLLLAGDGREERHAEQIMHYLLGRHVIDPAEQWND